MAVKYQALVTEDGQLTSVHSNNLSAATGSFASSRVISTLPKQ